MTDAILVMHGRQADAESPSASVVVATIYAPEQTDEGHHFCRVSLPTLFEDQKRIFGVDAEQAEEVACLFAREVLGGFDITITGEAAADKPGK